MTGRGGPLSPRLELSFTLAAVGLALSLSILPILLNWLHPTVPFWLYLLLATVPLQLMNLLSCVIPARKYEPEQPLIRLLDLQPPPRGQWPLIVIGTLSVYILLAAVSGCTVYLLKKIGIQPQEQMLVQLLREKSPLSIGLLPVMLLLAPAGEELCFRYAVFKKLEFHAGPVPATLLTGLIFAAVHLNLQVFPSLFLLSLWLGFLYRQTGSLLAAMAAHSLFNAISVLLILILTK